MKRTRVYNDEIVINDNDDEFLVLPSIIPDL